MFVGSFGQGAQDLDGRKLAPAETRGQADG